MQTDADSARGHLATEQRNPRSEELDRLSIGETLALINSEDQSIAGAVQAALPRIETFTEAVVNAFRGGHRLFYIGAGTSGRLGVLDASECPPTFSTPPEMVQGLIAGGRDALVRSVEGAEDRLEDGAAALQAVDLRKRDVVLGITTGGTTPYVRGGLAYSREIGAFTGLLLCTDEDEFADMADLLIPVIVGPEVVTGSTRMKAGTATKMVLNMITTAAMVALNKTYGNLMVDLTALNTKLWDRGARIIEELTDLSYAEAIVLLNSADGEVKTALAMQQGLSADDARTRLKAAEGSLRRVLEPGD